MKIRIVGSSTEGETDHQFLITYLIDDVLAVDAGSLGAMRLDAQQRVQDVCLTHSHLDHLATLPIFLENVFKPGPTSVRVHGLPETLAAVRNDLLNDRIWPDFVALSQPQNVFVRLEELAPERPVVLGNLTLTPIALDHTVPTVGYVVEDAGATVAIVSDTGPTHRIWEYLAGLPRLSAVFLECSFPNDMAWLAQVSGHLTPAQFRGEIGKLARRTPFFAVHLKPSHRAKIVAELTALGCRDLDIGRVGHDYVF